MKFRHRYIFKTATDAANKVLVRVHICVEPADRSRRADFSDQVLVFEKLQSAIDRGLRQPRQLLAQTAIDRFRRWVGQVFSQSPIDGKALGRDPDASSPAQTLKLRTPSIDFALVPRCLLVAADSHLRIIII